MNGVPTAYGDLESLLTNSEDQIQRTYTHLPPWLQKLVEQLPSKMTKSIGPEMLAAAAEKHGLNSKYANMAAKGASKAGLKVRVPSLKDLVTKPGVCALFGAPPFLPTPGPLLSRNHADSEMCRQLLAC